MHHALGPQAECALPYPVCSPGRLALLTSASQREGVDASSFIVLCIMIVYAAISFAVGELGWQARGASNQEEGIPPGKSCHL